MGTVSDRLSGITQNRWEKYNAMLIKKLDELTSKGEIEYWKEFSIFPDKAHLFAYKTPDKFADCVELVRASVDFLGDLGIALDDPDILDDTGMFLYHASSKEEVDNAGRIVRGWVGTV